VFTITLPLTLAIIDGLTAAVGEERYIVPLVSIVESVQLKADAVRSVVGGGELFRFRGEYLPVIRLHDAFACEGAVHDIAEGLRYLAGHPLQRVLTTMVALSNFSSMAFGAVFALYQ